MWVRICPDVGTIMLIFMLISEFCENLLNKDNSNNTFSVVKSQLDDSIRYFKKLDESEGIVC